jgi:hypothetical protein
MTDLNPWLPSMSLHEWQQRQLAILKVQFNYEMIVEKANELNSTTPDTRIATACAADRGPHDQ